MGDERFGPSPRRKAEDDLKNRTEDSGPLTAADTTFVFVTPRRWGKKDVWAAEKTKQGPWHRVKVLDADNVAAWLEEAPAVHTWLSVRIGKIPPGTNDLEAHWNEWSGATRPSLTPEIVLSGRDEAVAEMLRRLADASGQVFAVRAESRDEAIAWTYCVIRNLPPETANGILARCLVVESREAFRNLTGAPGAARAGASLQPRRTRSRRRPGRSRGRDSGGRDRSCPRGGCDSDPSGVTRNGRRRAQGLRVRP